MSPIEIFERLKEKFGRGVEWHDNSLSPFVRVEPGIIAQAAKFLKDAPGLDFDSLMCQTAADYPSNITVVYLLFSMKRLHKITLKSELPRDNPALPSVSPVWAAADWFEREIYDLFGVKFEGHGNLLRIMLPDDWEGHPLLKDYQYPDTYRGVPL